MCDYINTTTTHTRLRTAVSLSLPLSSPLICSYRICLQFIVTWFRICFLTYRGRYKTVSIFVSYVSIPSALPLVPLYGNRIHIRGSQHRRPLLLTPSPCSALCITLKSDLCVSYLLTIPLLLLPPPKEDNALLLMWHVAWLADCLPLFRHLTPKSTNQLST